MYIYITLSATYMFRLGAIFREMKTKKLKTHTNEIVNSRNMSEAGKLKYILVKYMLLLVLRDCNIIYKILAV